MMILVGAAELNRFLTLTLQPRHCFICATLKQVTVRLASAQDCGMARKLQICVRQAVAKKILFLESNRDLSIITEYSKKNLFLFVFFVE